MCGRKEIDFTHKIENNIYFLYPLPVHLFRRMDYDFFDKFIDDCGGEFLYPHILTDNCRKAVKVALILFVGIDFLGYTKYCKGYSDYKGLTREIEKSGNYKKTKEKARGQIETREYYQTEDIQWMIQKKDWKGLKSIAMERKSIEKNGRKKTECRYFISSLKGDMETISRAVRGHWSIESMHWHLDVTFREDANATLDKMSAQNLNIIRKWSLSILKLMELTKKKLSMKKKRFVISLSPIKYLEEVLDF